MSKYLIPPPIYDINASEEDNDKAFYKWQERESQARTNKKRVRKEEFIQDDEIQSGSIRKTKRSRRWMNSAYEGGESDENR